MNFITTANGTGNPINLDNVLTFGKGDYGFKEFSIEFSSSDNDNIQRWTFKNEQERDICLIKIHSFCKTRSL